jgi:hypothetical protein
VFENRLTGKNFVPKTKDLIREWRKLHNEELRDLYWSPNIVRAVTLRSMGVKSENVTERGN